IQASNSAAPASRSTIASVLAGNLVSSARRSGCGSCATRRAASNRIRCRQRSWPNSAPDLADFHRDPFQHGKETRAVAADDPVEHALVLASAAVEHGKRTAAGRRGIEAIGTAIPAKPLALDQPAPDQILHYGRQARFVAAIGVTELGLTDARVSADQC